MSETHGVGQRTGCHRSSWMAYTGVLYDATGATLLPQDSIDPLILELGKRAFITEDSFRPSHRKFRPKRASSDDQKGETGEEGGIRSSFQIVKVNVVDKMFQKMLLIQYEVATGSKKVRYLRNSLLWSKSQNLQ